MNTDRSVEAANCYATWRRWSEAKNLTGSSGGLAHAAGVICQNPHVATASVIEAQAQAPANRPNMVSVGTVVWLSSELMFFAGLFSMYLTLRGVNPEIWAEDTQLLNVPLAAANTTILVLSSVTCQIGVLAAERGDRDRMRKWFMITFVMGSVFVAGQIFEYSQLLHEGLGFSGDVYGSAFFLTTGFHGLHVVGGLVAFLFVLARTYVAKRFTHQQATSAIVVSYYWHFVDIVWIALFSMIYILQ